MNTRAFVSNGLKALSVVVGTVLILCSFPCVWADDDNADQVKGAEIINAVYLLTPDIYTSVNVKREDLARPIVNVTKRLESFINDQLIDQSFDGRLFITLRPNQAANYRLETRPPGALPPATHKDLISELGTLPMAKVAVFEMTMAFGFRVGDGDPSKKEWDRPLTDFEARMAALKAASLKEKLSIIQRFCRNYAIPILGAFMRNAEQKFLGVRSVGKLFEDLPLKGQIDITTILDQNPLYWRGMMEMQSGNPLVVASRVFLLANNGELDHAERYILLDLVNADDDMVAGSLLWELVQMIVLHRNDVKKQVAVADGLLEKGAFEKAEAAYGQILKVYPACAEAHYGQWEAAQSKDDGTVSADEIIRTWPKVGEAVYRYDPLFRRPPPSGLSDHFQNAHRERFWKEFNGELDDNFLQRYADLAHHLRIYPLSAEAHFTLYARSGDMKMFRRFVYASHKIGIFIEKWFKVDTGRIVAEIEAEDASLRKKWLSDEAREEEGRRRER